MVEIYISSGFIHGLANGPLELTTYLIETLKKFAPGNITFDIPEEEIRDFELHGLKVQKAFVRETSSIKISATPFSIELIETEYINRKIHHSKFFLICDTPEQAKSLREKHALFFASSLSLIYDFEQFFLQSPKSLSQSDLSVGVKKSPYQFTKWSDLVQRIIWSPFLLLSDRYCVVNTTDDPVEPNLVKLLSEFIKCQYPDIEVRIALNVPANSGDASTNLNNISKSDLEQLISKMALRPFKLKIHALSKTQKDKYKIHDKTRCIATNYYFVESADSFNYFNNNGQLRSKKFSIRIVPIFIESASYYFIKDFYDCFNRYLLNESKTLA